MVEFIFMLTHDDVTVANARDVLQELRAWQPDRLKYLGFKDIGLPAAKPLPIAATPKPAQPKPVRTGETPARRTPSPGQIKSG